MSFDTIISMIDEMITEATTHQFQSSHVAQNMVSETSKLITAQDEMGAEANNLLFEEALVKPDPTVPLDHEQSKLKSFDFDEPVIASRDYLPVGRSTSLEFSSKLASPASSTSICGASIPSTSHRSRSKDFIENNVRDDERVGGEHSIIDHLLSQSTNASCNICKKPCENALSLSCCQAQGCKACAIEYLTSHMRCWGCGSGTSAEEKDSVKEHVRVNGQPDTYEDQRIPHPSLISCDMCENPCQRAVSLPCCQVQGCRACAVKYITSNEECWGCATGASTRDIEIDLRLREAVQVVISKRSLCEEVIVELTNRREVRMRMAASRKILGLPSITKAKNFDSVIDISEEDRINAEQMEMDDIHDDRWNIMKETRTDKARVLLAKKMFGNAVETDPNKNLSFHGFRRAKGYNKRKHLQPSSFRIQSGSLLPLHGFRKIRKQDRAFGEAGPGSGEEEIERFSDEKIKITDIPDVMKDIFLEQLQKRYTRRYNKNDSMELKRFVKHYVTGFKETSDFFSFYNQGTNEKQISRERLEEMVDVEKIVGSFTQHYGPTEKTFCKDCGVDHRF